MTKPYFKIPQQAQKFGSGSGKFCCTALALTLFFSILTLSSCGGGDEGGDPALQGAIDSSCAVVSLNKEFDRVIDGVSCETTERAAIVRVFARSISLTKPNSEDWFPICTGTVIAPTKVLTAAHCVDEQILANRVIVGYGILENSATPVTENSAGNRLVAARRVIIPPGVVVSNGRLLRDVATLDLERGVAAAPLAVIGQGGAPLASTPGAQLGEIGYVYGYGITEVGSDNADFAELVGGAMLIDQVGNEYISTTFTEDSSNPCKGDSGGPIIVQRSSGPVIVGVVSQGSEEECDIGDVTTFTNLANAFLQNWLQRN